MTLADLHEIEGTEPPVSGGTWKATPDEVKASVQAVAESVDAWSEAKKAAWSAGSGAEGRGPKGDAGGRAEGGRGRLS